MPTFSEQLAAAMIDLSARQWKTLGVALAGAGYGGAAVIDPEALILFTAALGDADPRLRDESSDWCVHYGARLISASRLRNLRAGFPAESAQWIDEYITTVNARASTRWPVEEKSTGARDFSSSNKSKLPRMSASEALLRFQLRSLFGVTARAELVLALSLAPARGQFRAASELTHTGYSKRNVAMVLEDLALCELVSTKKLGNRVGYRLEQVPALCKLASAIRTAQFVRWDLRLALLTAVRSLVLRVERKRAILRSVEARRFAAEYGGALDALELSVPDVVDADHYFETFVRWALQELVL